MSVNGIEGIGFNPMLTPLAPSRPAAPAVDAGQEFGGMVLDGIERLEGVQDRADQMAVKAATGDLTDIHDYTMAASEAEVTTQLTVAVRNKALESFNEIMRMQVG